jgi:hypothetical protein
VSELERSVDHWCLFGFLIQSGSNGAIYPLGEKIVKDFSGKKSMLSAMLYPALVVSSTMVSLVTRCPRIL